MGRNHHGIWMGDGRGTETETCRLDIVVAGRTGTRCRVEQVDRIMDNE